MSLEVIINMDEATAEVQMVQEIAQAISTAGDVIDALKEEVKILLDGDAAVRQLIKNITIDALRASGWVRK